MSYDPKSDLVVLEARNVIESFDELGSMTYGVCTGSTGSVDDLINALPDQAEFDKQNGYDLVVVGNSDIGVVRT